MNTRRFLQARYLLVLAGILLGILVVNVSQITTSSQPIGAVVNDVGMVKAVAWSPDDSQLLIGGDGLYIYNLDDASLSEFTFASGPVTDVAWSPDGRVIATTNNSDVELWDSASRQHIASLEAHIQYRIFNSVAWSPDGTRLAAASQGGRPRGVVRLWDTLDYQPVFTITPQPPVNPQVETFSHGGYSSLAWSPDGSVLAAATVIDNSIELWNVVTGEKIATLESNDSLVTAMTWNNRLDWLASGTMNGWIFIWHMPYRQLIDRYQIDRTQIYALAWKSGENTLAVAHADGAFVWDWDRHTRYTLNLVDESAYDVAWDSTGRRLAVALSGRVVVFDT